MGGPAGTTPPPTLQRGEKLWRLVEYQWCNINAKGFYYVAHEVAFLNKVSLVRATYLSLNDVDSYVNANGQKLFVKFGIAVLDADAIMQRTSLQLNVTQNSYGWPFNTHVEVERSNGSKRLRATHPEVSELMNIANANPLVRPPQP